MKHIVFLLSNTELDYSLLDSKDVVTLFTSCALPPHPTAPGVACGQSKTVWMDKAIEIKTGLFGIFSPFIIPVKTY